MIPLFSVQRATVQVAGEQLQWLVFGPVFRTPGTLLDQIVWGALDQELAARAYAEQLGREADQHTLVDVRWTRFGPPSAMFTLQAFAVGKWRNTPVRAKVERNLRPAELARLAAHISTNSGGSVVPARLRWYDGAVAHTIEELVFHGHLADVIAQIGAPS